MPSFEKNLLTQRHKICSQETRDSTLLYVKNPEYLSHLGLNRYRVVTDRWTDRITIANKHYVLSRVKSCQLTSDDVASTTIACQTLEKAYWMRHTHVEITRRHKFYLFHDLLRPSISHHSVCSVITAHNLTPVKRDGSPLFITRTSMHVERTVDDSHEISTFQHGRLYTRTIQSTV